MDSAGDNPLVDHIAFKQISDDVYEVTAFLKSSRQWGFYGTYENSDLHIHVKQPPRIAGTPERKLSGSQICLDPGHGGSESGAIGCGGMKEADMNLAIALKFRDLLEAQGAHVIMTRTTDKLVSLEDRVAIANNNKVDILLSIHNNALPDGRDPWTEHGTSSDLYHPQAIELAKDLRSAVASTTKFGDLSTRWQNLALTRPSSMIASLYEVGFVINPDEYAALASDGQTDGS